MQGSEELPEDAGRLIRKLQWGCVERFSIEPMRYHPEVWVLVARSAHVNGYGRRERKSRRKFGQPSHFALEEGDGLSSWQAHHEVVAESPQGVVKPVGDVEQRPITEIWKLVTHDGSHNALVDVEVGFGPVHDAKLSASASANPTLTQR